MQLIAFDLTQLNSDVVRIFEKNIYWKNLLLPMKFYRIIFILMFQRFMKKIKNFTKPMLAKKKPAKL